MLIVFEVHSAKFGLIAENINMLSFVSIVSKLVVFIFLT